MQIDFPIDATMNTRRGILYGISVVAMIGVLADRAHSQCHTWDNKLAFPSLGYDGLDFETFDDGSGPALYAGGFFETPSRHVAKWNGTSWTAVPSLGNPGDYVICLAAFGSELYAGGVFQLQTPNGTRRDIAKLTPSGWVSPGEGVSAPILDMTVYDSGNGPELVAGGQFIFAGTSFQGRNRIARWDGSTWSALGNTVPGGGVNDTVRCLQVWDSGNGPELYVGGDFTLVDGTISVGGIARWNGTSWSAVGTGNQPVFAWDLAVFNDGTGEALYAIGPSPSPPFVLRRFDGSSWQDVETFPLGQGFFHLQVFDDGDGPALYGAGDFVQVGGVAARNIARFDGHSWKALGSGLNAHVGALGVYQHNGVSELVVSGEFGMAGALLSPWFATWHACETPLDTFCFGDGSLAPCPCGNQGVRHHGCRNSVEPLGAVLGASGSPANDSLVLTASRETPNALTILLQGSEELLGVNPFGDGLRCVGGTLVRLDTRNAVAGTVIVPGPGESSIMTRSAARGDPLGTGSVRRYQTYYRDVNAFCANGTFNVSNGVRVVW